MVPEPEEESDSHTKKKSWPRPRPGFANFETGAELECEKVTPANSDLKLVNGKICVSFFV